MDQNPDCCRFCCCFRIFDNNTRSDSSLAAPLLSALHPNTRILINLQVSVEYFPFFKLSTSKHLPIPCAGWAIDAPGGAFKQVTRQVHPLLLRCGWRNSGRGAHASSCYSTRENPPRPHTYRVLKLLPARVSKRITAISASNPPRSSSI